MNIINYRGYIIYITSEQYRHSYTIERDGIAVHHSRISYSTANSALWNAKVYIMQKG